MTYSRTHPSDLIAANKSWSADVKKVTPDFFTESAKQQSPKILWFGCGDSRVAESTVCACKPGDIFVHRNIANRFSVNDDSANAILEFAVKSVGVDHVVVVGHSKCGGCIAAHASAPPSPSSKPPATALARFIQPLIELRHTLPEGATVNDLAIANIKRSVDQICQSETMNAVWTGSDPSRKAVQVHGMFYELETGLLHDLGITRSAKE